MKIKRRKAKKCIFGVIHTKVTIMLYNYTVYEERELLRAKAKVKKRERKKDL